MGASYPVEKEDFGYSPETQSASAPPAASRPWPSQGFIDRRPFDPLDPAGYLEGFARHNMRISPGEIVRVGARAPIRK
jgi:hypothetical protein